MPVEGDPGLRRRLMTRLSRWSCRRHRYSRALWPYITDCMWRAHVVINHRSRRTPCRIGWPVLHHEGRPVVSLLDECRRLRMAHDLPRDPRGSRRPGWWALVLLQLLVHHLQSIRCRAVGRNLGLGGRRRSGSRRRWNPSPANARG